MRRKNISAALHIVGVVLCLFYFNQLAYSKKYVIFQNKESLDKQFKSILAEINTLPVTVPITIKISKGYYNLSQPIVINDEKHLITICGEKNKETVISGSIKISEWEVTADGLWRCRLPNTLEKDYLPDQLFVNGKRARRARTPNEGVFCYKDVKNENLHNSTGLNKVDIKRIPIIGDDDLPIIISFQYWMASRRYVVKKSGENVKEVLNKLASGNGLILENAKSCIDTPGEWYVDKYGYIYYMPRKGEKIGKTEFRIPILEKLLLVKTNKQESKISFKNLVFEHTSFQIPIDGIVFGQAASTMSAAIEVDEVCSLSFEECEIRNIANYGLWLRKGCTNSIVRSSFFHDLGAGGIKIGTLEITDDSHLTHHIVVENNIINNYGILAESAAGIVLFNASNCAIKNNDIHYGNYTGVSLGWVWGYGYSPSKNNEVAYNRISHIGTGKLNDLGGIYTLGKSDGTHIHHNVISDVVSGDFRGWGVYADEGTSDVVFEKNLIFRCTSGGFHLHYGMNNRVVNNIFAWGEKSQFTLSSTKEEKPLTFKRNIIIMEEGTLMSGSGAGSKKIAVGNNCYWSTSSNRPMVGDVDIDTWIGKWDTTSVFKNPNFRNPQEGDFHFKDRRACNSIGFKTFDYTKAGVKGNRNWRKLALRNISALN